MMKRFDNILLGLLWTVVVALGACFWFNLRFGFNIFSGAHWHYLATLQASRANIATGFYISLIIAIIIAFAGVYVIIRPRRRIKIITDHTDNRPNPIPQASTEKSDAPAAPAASDATAATDAPTPANTPHPAVWDNDTNRATVDNTSSTLELPRAEPAPQRVAPTRPSVRPPRLNLSSGFVPAAPVANTANASAPAVVAPSANVEREYPEIAEMFRNAGYLVKEPVYVRGVRPALVAIGPDDELWVGMVGTDTTVLQGVVERFRDVFIDTLDTIEIAIHAFVVLPASTATATDNIITFDSIDMLRQYMDTHPAPRVDYDDENLAAYSEYIDTVLKYIGKS